MPLINHVQLRCSSVFQLLVAVKTGLGHMCLLRYIVKQGLKRNKAVDIKNKEGMGDPHMIEILFDSVKLLVAEDANS